MRALQKELDELREVRQRETEREALRAREDEDELRILRDRCESLEEERGNRQGEVSPLAHQPIFLSNTEKFVDRLTWILLTNCVPIWKAYFQNLTISLAVTTS